MGHIFPIAGLQLAGWRARQRLERAKLAALVALGSRPDLDPDGRVAKLAQERLAIARSRRRVAR